MNDSQYYVSECPETNRQFLVESGKDGNIVELTSDNVKAIRAIGSSDNVEVMYYDGETGVYHLLDIPDGLSGQKLLEHIRDALQYQVYVELDYIDIAMKSVYLIPVSAITRIGSL